MPAWLWPEVSASSALHQQPRVPPGREEHEWAVLKIPVLPTILQAPLIKAAVLSVCLFAQTPLTTNAN